MNLYFADRKLMIKGMGSTAIDAPYLITDDLYKEDIDTGLATLEFDLHYSDMSDSQIQEMVVEGNYILYDGLQGQTTFIILEMERDPIERKVYIYAEDAGIDLINEVLPEFTAPKDPQGIIFYIDQMGLLNEGYEVVRNEVSKKTRTLSFSSGQTGTQRLAELANSFEAEVKFRFEFVGLNISRRFIDIYERRGKRIDVELRLGREIENVVEKRSISNIATALWAVGSPIEVNGEEGDPITLNDTVYDDGNFYTVNGSYLLKSRSALSRWGRFGASGDYNYAHVIRMFSYDTTNKTELLNRTIEALKKASEPEVTYSVSLLYLPEDLQLGDTVNIVDDKSGLYLGARLLKLEVSEANDTRNAEFGEYIVKTSGINQSLFNVRSTVSKNYTWIVYADDLSGKGITTNPVGKKYIGIAENKITKDPIMTNPLLYKWSKIEGEDGTDGVSPTVEMSKEGLMTTLSITDAEGTKTTEIIDGTDGVSPTVEMSKEGLMTTLSITDAEGTKTTEIEDGFSPVATVEKEGTTTTISITDKNGTTTATVEDGKDEENQHFFYDQNGAHITLGERTADEGRNVLIRNNGLRIRDGVEDLASFLDEGIDLGAKDSGHLHLESLKSEFYTIDGDRVGLIEHGGAATQFTGTKQKSINSPGTQFQALLDLNVDFDIAWDPTATVIVIFKGENFLSGEDIEFKINNKLETYPYVTDENGYYRVKHEVIYDESLGHNVNALAVETLKDPGLGPNPSFYYTWHYIQSIPSANVAFGNVYDDGTNRRGANTFVSGDNVRAIGRAATALGRGVFADSKDQTVIGRFNEIDNANKYAFIIGNGRSNDDRSNALTVDWEGNINGSSLGDYTALSNKPKIEGVTLEGDKTFEELNLDRLTNSDIEAMLALADQS